MLTGGASIGYAKILLERENAAVFISGYTDEESPGRFLQSLEPGSEIELDGTPLTVRAKIQRFNLSAHAVGGASPVENRVGITQVIHLCQSPTPNPDPRLQIRPPRTLSRRRFAR
jgi:Cft2 family RNA processing exonuclease